MANVKSQQTPEDSERRKPGVLQSMWSQRVGHDLAIEQQEPISALPGFLPLSW